MSKLTTNQRLTLKGALPIRILAISALLVALFSFFAGFVFDCIKLVEYMNYKYIKPDIIEGFFYYFKLSEFVYALLALTPMVLFTVYLFGLYKHKNSGMLMTAILGIFAVKYLSALELLLFFACILTIITAFLEFRNKIFVVISMSAVLFCLTGLSVVKCSDLFFGLSSGYRSYLFFLEGITALMEIGSAVIFVIAILLFGLKNNTQLIATVPVEEETDPEQELLDLREQYDAGQISEEEYQAQRTEIISKL